MQKKKIQKMKKGHLGINQAYQSFHFSYLDLLLFLDIKNS